MAMNNIPLCVWSADRSIRKGVTSSSFEQFKTSCQRKFGITNEIMPSVCFVLNENGTEIDEDFYQTLERNTVILLLQTNKGEIWHPETDNHKYKPDEENSSECDFEMEVSENEIRIVMLGKTGTGKSSTGNSILGMANFKCALSPASVTTFCEEGTVSLYGKSVTVVDTPGIFDTSRSFSEIQDEIVKCVEFTMPGPHAFLLVIKLDDRYTAEGHDAGEIALHCFGDEVYKYTIVLFTGEDMLRINNTTVQSYLKECPKLQKVISKCGGRYIAFNNKADGVRMKEQVKELFIIIQSLILYQNKENPYYSRGVYEAARSCFLEMVEKIKRKRRKKHKLVLTTLQKEVDKIYEKGIIAKERELSEILEQIRLKEKQLECCKDDAKSTCIKIELESLRSIKRKIHDEISRAQTLKKNELENKIKEFEEVQKEKDPIQEARDMLREKHEFHEKMKKLIIDVGKSLFYLALSYALWKKKLTLVLLD